MHFFGFWSIVMFLMSLFFLATFLVLFSLLFIVFIFRRVLFWEARVCFSFFLLFSLSLKSFLVSFLRRFVRTLKPVKAAVKICTTFDLAHMNARIIKIDFLKGSNIKIWEIGIERGRVYIAVVEK